MAIPELQTCNNPIVQNYQRTLQEVRENIQEEFEKLNAHIAVKRLARVGRNGKDKAHVPASGPRSRVPSDPFEP